MASKEINKKQLNYYKKMLGVLGSLTHLFSDDEVPYLDYRISENLFCKSFNAKNLARADVSADAAIENTGIGIKTFRDSNGKSLQKIAEFNKDRVIFKGLSATEKIKKISELRNERIEATQRIYNLSEMKYHLITRKKGKMSIFEEEIELIDIPKIKNINESENTISFHDGKNEYSFNASKSTLYKRFILKKHLFEIFVKILEDPFEVLEKRFSEVQKIYYAESKQMPQIILPLYSRAKYAKEVHEKSGLNQWNASGRLRDLNEIYVPIPIWIHKRFPGFFPPRDRPFELMLPNGKILNAKVCQDNSKALMTNPNSALGKWLLRDVLNLKKGELLTYKKLQKIGLDSVALEKKDNNAYLIHFRPSNTYEKFREENS